MSPKNFWLIWMWHKLRNNPQNKDTQSKEEEESLLSLQTMEFHTPGVSAVDPVHEIHSEYKKRENLVI